MRRYEFGNIPNRFCPHCAYQTGEYLLTLQIPGKGGDDDVVSAMLFVQGYVWAASSDGSINIFNATVGCAPVQRSQKN